MDDDPNNDKLRGLAKQLGRAAADNALQLIEEANLLDENGHRARAFALTVLAAEELGKAFICEMTAAHADDPDTWGSFAAMVAGPKRHETKLLAMLFLVQKVPGLTGHPVDRLAHELSDLVAGDLDDAKMRALYVDIEAGQIATPGRVAGHEGAHQRARALRREMVGWGVILASERLENGSASQDSSSNSSSSSSTDPPFG